MENHSFLRAWWVILLAAAFLLIYPALHERIPLLRDKFRGYNFYESLRSTRPKEKPKPVAIRPSKPAPEVKNPATEIQISAYDQNTSLYHGLTFLNTFFEKIRQRKGQIRIAYFGDSSIEGDLICQTFRDSLQKRFGGQGVGFVGIENPIPGFRQSVRLSFSPTWQRKTIIDKDPGRFPFGISGEYFRAWFPKRPPTDSASAPGMDTLPPPTPVRHWSEWAGSKSFYGTKAFSQARLFYGQAQRDSLTRTKNKVNITINGRRAEFLLDGVANVNSIELTDTLVSRIRADFNISGSLPLYGVSLESPAGIIVDNFSMRGNSGRSLMRIQSAELISFQELLDYDLIIFQYGLNVLNANMKNFAWYTREINQVIQHFQEAMPGVPILLVGPSDKSIKVGTVMQSDPSVYVITEAQRKSAIDKKCAFFSLYEAMGGEDSMVDWVERRRPKLANLDYTHFNSNGAKVAGNFLLSYLLGGYREYELAYEQKPL